MAQRFWISQVFRPYFEILYSDGTFKDGPAPTRSGTRCVDLCARQRRNSINQRTSPDAQLSRNSSFVRPSTPHFAAFAPQVHSIRYDTLSEGAVDRAINRVSRRVPYTWMYYCYNAEYVFYLFCESRSINEFLVFNKQEERAAVVTYIIDLYAADMRAHPNAVCTQTAQIGSCGYYAQARVNPSHHNFPKEQQLDFFGGLR